jgi:hypothetical protein
MADMVGYDDGYDKESMPIEQAKFGAGFDHIHEVMEGSPGECNAVEYGAV